VAGVNIAVGWPSLERATLSDSTSPNLEPSAAPAAEPASTAPAASESGQSAVSPSSSEAKKSAYVAPAPLATQEGPRGIRFDYNEGCRIVVPEGEPPWRIRLSDIETGNVLYATTIKAGRVASAKRYFVPVRIEVWQNDVSLRARLFGQGPRRPDPVPGRHARRHGRLVPLCGEV
jgi:hypothetical protein